MDLDGPWNLVLACTTCNRGLAGKFANIPHRRYLQRLYTRNEYLIASHHPLRETLMLSTGIKPAARRQFLIDVLDQAEIVGGGRTGWVPPNERPALF